MSAANFITLFAFIVSLSAVYAFLYRGRQLGYKALALRVHELHAAGMQQVWLARPNKGAGLAASGRNPSIWGAINTGALFYVREGSLIVELPWWNKMQQLQSVPLAQVDRQMRTTIYASRKYQALHITDQSYIIVGLNVQDAATVRQLLKLRDQHSSDLLAQSFLQTIA